LNTRPDWEIATALHCQNAVSYLRLAELTGARAKIYESIYKTGDIKRWAKRHAKAQVEMANEKTDGSDCVVRSVEAGWSDALHATGLSGNVKIVGITKIEKPQVRTAAYTAWWHSLLTPPYNASKSAEHEALAVAQHEAWAAFGGGIREAQEIIGGNDECCTDKW